jgi:hypothetical protein
MRENTIQVYVYTVKDKNTVPHNWIYTKKIELSKKDQTVIKFYFHQLTRHDAVVL